MVNVLKFRTLVACQKGIEDSAGTDQTAYKTRIFSVCYSDKHLGDNCIQNFHLGRYIVGNFVLWRRASGAVKRDFRRIPSQNENLEYGYPHSNALLQFRLKFERCKLRNTAHHPTKYDVINDVKLFPAVYRRINCRKFLTLSNTKSRYKSKCIRICELQPEKKFRKGR